MPSGEAVPRFVWSALCIDCAPADFERMVAFYRDLFDWKVWETEPRWASIGTEADPMILIQAEDWYAPPVWPEETAAQAKMMHLEVKVEDIDAGVARAVALGAREAPHQPPDRDISKLRVMLDPAGHIFCLWN